MRPRTLVLPLVLGLAGPVFAAAGNPWRDVNEGAVPAHAGPRVVVPQRYRLLALDRRAFQELMAQAPLEFAQPPGEGRPLLALPLPEGGWLRFQVEESPIMEPALAAQLPEVRTWRGQGVDDPTATTRFGWTSAGFHAIVLRAAGTVYIDPYRRGDTIHHISYAKRDYWGAPGFKCGFVSSGDEPAVDAYTRIPSGDTLRTYRLALAANVEYSDFHSNQNPPNKNDVMNNGIIPTMNRVNGIYEREVAVRMVLVAGQLNIIFVTEPDGYTNGSGGQMISANQGIIDGIIGNANYDIGHVFSTGGGGVAGLRVVCVTGNKARGVTGRGQPIGDPFDVDYVAHEMGHQFGGNHTFNGFEASCGGNRNAATAYEVGSGSTIMAYAGICGTQDLQPNSDDYFQNINFVEIQAFTTTGSGNNCPTTNPTGNQAPVVDAGATFNIPSRTPFALTATGSDPNGDPLTFLWEEMDLGPSNDGRTDNGSSPILRSFKWGVGPTRLFPRLSDILNNTVTYGELLPTTTRTMRFRVTARDNRAAGGGVDWDETTVTSQMAAGPFR
ncbi:MAG TPA: zinc-dependent metalloprotease family protein, partial [Vicinamibacteria bacterium]|nr:zinc-dependent metalloprotease family protein [Vicinamibacteria bacterium]